MATPARVLWVTENYPPDRGGMAQSCDRIVRGLRAAGVTVDVAHLSRRALRPGPDRLGADLLRHDVHVAGAHPGAGRGPAGECGGRVHTVALADGPEHALRALWTTLEREASGYSHVVAFGGTYPLLAAPVYAAWSGAPLVTLLRGNDLDTGVFSLRRQAVVLEALRSSAGVCVVAGPSARLVSALAPGTEVTWVPNGIDLDDWKVLPSERRRADRWRSDAVAAGRRTLGLVGHLKEKKGVRLLLDALVASGHADRFHLLLVGELGEDVAAWLDAHAGVVACTRLPFLDRYDLPWVYAACDLVALPSFYDGMPNVALEAAGLGVPLLASDAGGLADLVDAEVGFPFPAGDLHACRAAVHEVALASDGELTRRGEAGRERISRRFTPKVETEGYLQVLRRTAATIGR